MKTPVAITCALFLLQLFLPSASLLEDDELKDLMKMMEEILNNESAAHATPIAPKVITIQNNEEELRKSTAKLLNVQLQVNILRKAVDDVVDDFLALVGEEKRGKSFVNDNSQQLAMPNTIYGKLKGTLKNLLGMGHRVNEELMNRL